jgi:hypothetical protein
VDSPPILGGGEGVVRPAYNTVGRLSCRLYPLRGEGWRLKKPLGTVPVPRGRVRRLHVTAGT